MHIDPTRFLVLTAAISAAGCDRLPTFGANDSIDGGTNPSGPSATTASASPAASADAGHAAARTASHASSASPHGHHDPPVAPSTPDGGSTPASAMHLAGPGCDNNQGGPADCSKLKAPLHDCETFTVEDCTSMRAKLKPRVAEQLVACYQAASHTRAFCDSNKTMSISENCLATAVREACIEPGMEASCAPVVKSCRGALSTTNCQALLSATPASRHKDMITCMTEGCSVGYCSSWLTQGK
jgi:hypothetical protein